MADSEDNDPTWHPTARVSRAVRHQRHAHPKHPIGSPSTPSTPSTTDTPNRPRFANGQEVQIAGARGEFFRLNSMRGLVKAFDVAENKYVVAVDQKRFKVHAGLLRETGDDSGPDATNVDATPEDPFDDMLAVVDVALKGVKEQQEAAKKKIADQNSIIEQQDHERSTALAGLASEHEQRERALTHRLNATQQDLAQCQQDLAQRDLDLAQRDLDLAQCQQDLIQRDLEVAQRDLEHARRQQDLDAHKRTISTLIGDDIGPSKRKSLNEAAQPFAYRFNCLMCGGDEAASDAVAIASCGNDAHCLCKDCLPGFVRLEMARLNRRENEDGTPCTQLRCPFNSDMCPAFRANGANVACDGVFDRNQLADACDRVLRSSQEPESDLVDLERIDRWTHNAEQRATEKKVLKRLEEDSERSKMITQMQEDMRKEGWDPETSLHNVVCECPNADCR